MRSIRELGIFDVAHAEFPDYFEEHYIEWNDNMYKIVRAHVKGELQNFPMILYMILQKNPVTK